MVQGSGGKSLLLKAAQAVGVRRERWRQNLDRHLTFETRVAGTIDLAHPASAKEGGNLIRPELRSGGQIHAWARLSLRGKSCRWLRYASRKQRNGIGVRAVSESGRTLRKLAVQRFSVEFILPARHDPRSYAVADHVHQGAEH